MPTVGDTRTPRTVVKAVAEVQPADETTDSPNGAFEVILSTPTEDRDGEKVASDEWKMPLPDHITFDVDHGMSVATTVGSGTPRIEADGTLRVSGTYASTPKAQEARALVNEGHIRTVSVAFLRSSSPVKGGKPAVTRELLNGAFVAVPANPEALILASKAGARNSMSDQQHLQAAHDSTVSAGADCPGASKSAVTAFFERQVADYAAMSVTTDEVVTRSTAEPEPTATAPEAAAAENADEAAALELRLRALRVAAETTS